MRTPTAAAEIARHAAQAPARFNIRMGGGSLEIRWHGWTSAMLSVFTTAAAAAITASVIFSSAAPHDGAWWMAAILIGALAAGASYFAVVVAVDRSASSPTALCRGHPGRGRAQRSSASRSSARNLFHVELSLAGQRRHRFRQAFDDEQEPAFLAELLRRDLRRRAGS